MAPRDLLRNPTRMDAVQTPIIPTIGGMVRATPGCISLGQGVVHYQPPRESASSSITAIYFGLISGAGCNASSKRARSPRFFPTVLNDA